MRERVTYSAQVTSSWLLAKKQHSSQLYMQKRNRTELHIADLLIERITAAWRNWKRITFALVRLAFRRGGAGQVLDCSTVIQTAFIQTLHQGADILQLGEEESTRVQRPEQSSGC